MPTINPGTDLIQAVINANGPGTTYTLAAGTHRVTTPIVPKAGDIIVGAGNLGDTSLSGAKLLTGWAAEAGGTGRYFVTGQSQSEIQGDPGVCYAGGLCHLPFELYYSDALGAKRRQSTKSAVNSADKWFFDDSANVIWVWGNPGSAVTDVSLSNRVVYSGASNITLRNLVIEKSANLISNAMIEGHSGASGWIIEDCDIRYGHGINLRMMNDMRVRRCKIHHSMQTLAGGQGANWIMEDCELYVNNYHSLYSIGHEGGGTKWATDSHDWIIRRCYFHDLVGPGLWLDHNVYNFEVYDCRFDDIERAGFFQEVGQNGIVRDNVFRRCGININSQVEEWEIQRCGIQTSASHHVEIYNNIIEDCVYGITMMQQRRDPPNTPEPQAPNPWAGLVANDHKTRDMYIHDNIIANASSSAIGICAANDDPTWYPDMFNSIGNNRCENNHYYLGAAGASQSMGIWQGFRTWAGWHSVGHDDTGVASFLPYSAYTPWSGEPEPPVEPGAPFVTNSFAGTPGTALTSLNGALGGPWLPATGDTGTWVVTDANRLRMNVANARSIHYADAVGTTNEYDVSVDMYVASIIPNHFYSIFGRMDPATGLGWHVEYDTGNLIWSLVDDTAQLTYVSDTLVVGNTYTVKLQIRNSAKKVFVNGVERLSVPNDTPTIIGRVGIGSTANDTAPTNTTGIHYANFSATLPSGMSVPIMLNVFSRRRKS